MVNLFDMGEKGRCKEMGNFNKGQIIMARWQGWSISNGKTHVVLTIRWHVPANSGTRSDSLCLMPKRNAFNSVQQELVKQQWLEL